MTQLQDPGEVQKGHQNLIVPLLRLWNRGANLMSEFKFACPVCGQHLTADSSNSGTQIDCPTCFQKIVVPQAPAEGDPKFILSAAQANRPRPSSLGRLSDLGPLRRSGSLASLIATVLLIVLLVGGGSMVYVYRRPILKVLRPAPEAELTPATNTMAGLGHRPSPYPVPTNTSWTLDLSKAVIPQTQASGRIHGSGFLCERAVLTGGALSLRQGRGWPPDLGFGVMLAAQRGEDLSGKTVVVNPGANAVNPHVVLRWKDDQEQARKEDVLSGYALKITFGQAVTGRIPGKIFISAPDESNSFVAGTFEAEIRKPQQANK